MRVPSSSSTLPEYSSASGAPAPSTNSPSLADSSILTLQIQTSPLIPRRMRATEFQELFGEAFHVFPLRVHVVAGGVGVRAALVAGDPLHHVAFYEAVLRVEQSAAKEANHAGTPARLLHELLDVALCDLGVV